MTRRQNKRIRYDYDYDKSWWVRDFGGMPGWGLVAAGLLIGVGLVALAAFGAFTPR